MTEVDWVIIATLSYLAETKLLVQETRGRFGELRWQVVRVGMYLPGAAFLGRRDRD